MTAGRPPIKTPETIDMEATLDKPRVNTAVMAMQTMAQQEQKELATDVFALGRLVGAAQMAGSISTISAVAEVRAFCEVNKSKVFKSLYINIGGEFRPAENIDEFCRTVFGGRGYKAMMERKAALESLGEDMFECVSRLGLNRAQQRLLINLPEDTRSAVEEAMQAGSKSDVVTLIQSLANQLDEAKEKVDELKAEQVATEQVSSDKSKLIDKLRIDLSRVKKLPPDEVLAEIQREATAMLNDTRGALIGKFSACVEAIDAHHTEHGGDSAVFLAGLVGQLQVDLNALRDRFGIPDVAPAMIPEWVNDPSFAALAKE